MTRDEAIKILNSRPYDPGTTTNAIIVDSLVALGILKLDEPKTPEDELREALIGLDDAFGLDVNDVMTALNTYGLKVVRA